ncbi:MAG: 4-(cytidine 5'-diphospho)-2-C-methyl-D-erythritol kinase [Hyphomicrobiaceae bacterium]|nr:4-(cytidine 5'-diphospho)-2-C-methyl-D-erythritol kinase [Hyphomicrobiaceae bacterium]
MQLLKETAPAKVNLTLKVLGRRADGFHQIESLAAFTGCGDRLELNPGNALGLSIEGPFADKLSGANLVVEAARVVGQRCPDVHAGHFRLVKRLPVAAGLGGGSADAAAALRLLHKANETKISSVDMFAAAEQLGSDVSVCLSSRAAVMRGRGEEISPARTMPVLPAVLANPGVELGAGEVYAALDAGPCDDASGMWSDGMVRLQSTGQVGQLIQSIGNDLADAAIGLAPVVGKVRAVLGETEGCLAAEMSGSGPTCFGIYESTDHAQAAARHLAGRYSDWWIVATELS